MSQPVAREIYAFHRTFHFQARRRRSLSLESSPAGVPFEIHTLFAGAGLPGIEKCSWTCLPLEPLIVPYCGAYDR
jgi:hypothetical protein